jgi:methylmalonyl-CoA epimerase
LPGKIARAALPRLVRVTLQVKVYEDALNHRRGRHEEEKMKIDHIAIAVSSLQDALGTFETLWGMTPERTERVDSDKVTEAMLPIGDTYLQLLEPTDESSTIAKYIERRGEGLHHIAIRVDDSSEIDALMSADDYARHIG